MVNGMRTGGLWVAAGMLMMASVALGDAAKGKTYDVLAAESGVPIVVEMFTSKYCPNCPAAEHKMVEVAPENPDLLIVFEHVDYWDRGDATDPYGLADVTQRQYDYSNVLMERAGQVFTPMLLFNGRHIAAPPLMFSLDKAMKAAREGKKPLPLTVAKLADGGLAVDVPAKLAKGTELYVLGLEPVDGGPVMRLRGIVQADVKAGTVRVPPALLPKFERLLVLLQSEGPTDVVGVGRIGW